VLAGKKYPSWKQASTIRKCRKGKLDAAVVSVKSGKNGCNLQGMNWMVSLGWIPAYTEEEQAKGNTKYVAANHRPLLPSWPDQTHSVQGVVGCWGTSRPGCT